MAELNLFHELLHAFGARHDPPPFGAENGGAASECNPSTADAAANGRYVMSRFSNNGRRRNHEVLSSCSRRAVSVVLKTGHRTRCLRWVGPKL